MHCTARVMEECRRSQEATEVTSAIMDKLPSASVLGRSEAGLGIGGDGEMEGWGQGQGDLQQR